MGYLEKNSRITLDLINDTKWANNIRKKAAKHWKNLIKLLDIDHNINPRENEPK